MRFAPKELLSVPDQAAQVDWQRAILLGVAEDLIPEHTHVLLNCLVLLLQDLAGIHAGPNGLQGVLLQIIRLEAWIIEVVGIHSLHCNNS